jgi:uncharacterized protein
VLLDDRFCQLFAAHRIKVGISLDGDRAANDRHRRYADGRSSYDKVIDAIGLLRDPRYRPLYAGLLCTIDIANDPVTTYESLLALGPPLMDFLLPHGTWDNPPARPAGKDTAYAEWLIAVFDRWIAIIPWLDERVPATALAAAQRLAKDHRAAWSARGHGEAP